MYYENTVLERLKQLNIGGKGKYCRISMCKNVQCDKDWKKTKQVGISLFKFPDKDAKQDCINCGVIKAKHSKELVRKICLKKQITQTYANFILMLLI